MQDPAPPHGQQLPLPLPPQLSVGIVLRPSTFTCAGEEGDIDFELQQGSAGPCALYVSNDNARDHCSSSPGGGSAAIRPFNSYGAHRGPPVSWSVHLPKRAAATRSWTQLSGCRLTAI
jgi:hypothetical protein